MAVPSVTSSPDIHKLPAAPRLQPVAFGSLKLYTRWLLSPLAGFTNLPFRRVVREIGGLGLATTDLVNARALLAGNRKSWWLTESCAADTPYAVQIFGSDAATMCSAAQLLQERNVDAIDINMGCPVARITKGGSGAGLMCRVDETIELVRRVIEGVQIPVTVKMRLGWDNNQITAPQFARAFEEVGAAGIAIHGRTREQGFKGAVDLDGIGRVVAAVSRVPVIGNGDVRTIADAERMLRETGCQGVSIGRGALANPWIFRQLEQWERTGRADPPGSFDDRLALLKKQFSYLEEWAGTESAVIGFRKMGHWYLKSMRVRAYLRHQFQQARTKAELDELLRAVCEEGPVRGTRTGELPGMQIPVPSGPVERW
jgi:nifR3 family TIM-barrel protein